MSSCAAVSLQWAGAALLLLVLPLARGNAGEPDFEELAWSPGSPVEDTLLQQQPFLFLPQQMSAVERAKRTNLVSEMRGGMGVLGHLGGQGVQGMGDGGGPSLSIAHPLDVIRQRLRLQMVRKHLNKVMANRELLDNVGKRSGPSATQMQQDDLRGLLLRRYERNIRAEEQSTSTPKQQRQSHSQGGSAFP